MSETEFLDFASDELIKMQIINSKEQIKDYHVEKVQKAYPAYFDTYDRIDEVIEYVNTFENLYCMGRNGQHRYNNMDHSMVTAMVAAELIKTGNSDKKELWNVNTEKEYHEKK